MWRLPKLNSSHSIHPVKNTRMKIVTMYAYLQLHQSSYLSTPSLPLSLPAFGSFCIPCSSRSTSFPARASSRPALEVAFIAGGQCARKKSTYLRPFCLRHLFRHSLIVSGWPNAAVTPSSRRSRSAGSLILGLQHPPLGLPLNSLQRHSDTKIEMVERSLHTLHSQAQLRCLYSASRAAKLHPCTIPSRLVRCQNMDLRLAWIHSSATQIPKPTEGRFTLLPPATFIEKCDGKDTI